MATVYSADQPRSHELARKFWRVAYPQFADTEIERFAAETLDPVRAAEALDSVAARVPFDLANRRLLEIGSGAGTVVLVARQRGIDAHGVEPHPLGSAAALWNLHEHGEPSSVVTAAGEALPYADASFDVVCSFQVLEHTREPSQVLTETIRVLKPGGYFVHVFPNYGSVWEGHYGVPWIPHLPKWLGYLYVRILGRDLGVMEELQLLSHESIARMMRRHPNVEIVDWGMDLWEHRVRTLNFSEWGYLGRLKSMVRWAHQLRVVDFVVRVGRRLHLETPIVLVGKKYSSAVADRPTHRY